MRNNWVVTMRNNWVVIMRNNWVVTMRNNWPARRSRKVCDGEEHRSEGTHTKV